PEPEVVRSSFQSWIMISLPSRVMLTSHSIISAPSSMAFSKAMRVFSGYSVEWPRCEMARGRSERRQGLDMLRTPLSESRKVKELNCQESGRAGALERQLFSQVAGGKLARRHFAQQWYFGL